MDIGDKVLCKKDYYNTSGKLLYKNGSTYTISGFSGSTIVWVQW